MTRVALSPPPDAMRQLALLVLCGALCTSCTVTRTSYLIEQSYRAPEADPPQASRIFSAASFDAVWESVVRFFAERHHTIATIEKDSGIIVARRATGRSRQLPTVLAGEIETTVREFRDIVTADQWEGSMNPSFVRAHGKLKERSPADREPEVWRSRADYGVSIAWNIHVERTGAEEGVRVTVNALLEPTESLAVHNGYYIPQDGERGMAGPEALFHYEQHFRGVPDLVMPTPLSNGQFETAILDYIESQVATRIR